MDSRHRLWLAGVAGITIAALVGLAIVHLGGRSRTANSLIAPEASDKMPPQLGALDLDHLSQRVGEYLTAHDTSYSFYFELLPTGRTIDSHEDDLFVAASLLKLPYVMELYKERELGLISFDEQIDIKPEWIDSRSGDLWKRGPHSSILLQQAIDMTLTKSDNTALNVVKGAGANKLTDGQRVTQFLDIDVPKDPTNGIAYINTRSYASLLRCLYRTCYLNDDDSQEILEYLTRSESTALRSGVPSSVKVADKFGIAYDRTQPPVDRVIYGDCGIVYATDRPYIECLITKSPGDSYRSLHKDVANMVYTTVTQAATLKRR
jgi:hypothetical protein